MSWRGSSRRNSSWGSCPGTSGSSRTPRTSRGREVEPVLATLCANADEDTRLAAVNAIGWRARRRTGPVEPLLKALRHKDATTQFVAAEGLARVGRSEGLAVLLSGLESIDDVTLRQRAVLALGELADARAVDTLLKLAGEDGHALQEAAAEAIGHLGKSGRAEEVAKALERLARSPQQGVAVRALAGLRHLNTVAGWRIIRAKVKDASWRVKEAACEQLGYDADPASRAVLLDVLRTDAYRGTVGAALDAALKLLGADSLEPFYAAVENWQHSDAELGRSELVPLDIVCDKGDALRLLAIFPRCSPDLQERIESALSARPNVPAAEATEALTHADDATVRLAARLLAGATGPPAAATKALAEALKVWRAKWAERRQAFDRTGDRRPLDAASACLQTLLWAATRLGAAGDAAAELAAARPDDPLAKPLRLDALRLLASAAPLPKKALTAVGSAVGRRRRRCPNARVGGAGGRRPGALGEATGFAPLRPADVQPRRGVGRFPERGGAAGGGEGQPAVGGAARPDSLEGRGGGRGGGARPQGARGGAARRGRGPGVHGRCCGGNCTF